MARFAPLPYSPFADFAAARDMTLRGVEYRRGDKIDKAGLGERQLRTLFDARKIVPLAFAGPAPSYFQQPPAAPAPPALETPPTPPQDAPESAPAGEEGGAPEPITATAEQLAASIADLPPPERRTRPRVRRSRASA